MLNIHFSILCFTTFKLFSLYRRRCLYQELEIITLARLLVVIYHLIALNIYSSYMENICVRVLSVSHESISAEEIFSHNFLLYSWLHSLYFSRTINTEWYIPSLLLWIGQCRIKLPPTWYKNWIYVWIYSHSEHSVLVNMTPLDRNFKNSQKILNNLNVLCASHQLLCL